MWEGVTVKSATSRVSLGFLVVLVVAAALGAAGGSATGTQRLTVYAVATRAQFVNTADGIARAVGHNPFNTDTKALVPKNNGKGPLPGDTAIYSFKLYTSSDRKHSIGTGIYNCTYDFGESGICEATFYLTSGNLSASGPVDFTSSDYTLAVTGGTSRYLGVSGQVAETPAVKSVTRLEFVLLSLG
jgi:hypothetical protein